MQTTIRFEGGVIVQQNTAIAYVFTPTSIAGRKAVDTVKASYKEEVSDLLGSDWTTGGELHATRSTYWLFTHNTKSSPC